MVDGATVVGGGVIVVDGDSTTDVIGTRDASVAPSPEPHATRAAADTRIASALRRLGRGRKRLSKLLSWARELVVVCVIPSGSACDLNAKLQGI